MSKGMIEFKEDAPSLVRIIPSIEGIVTQDRYIEIARELLENGLPLENDQRLKNDDSMDFKDNMLLFNENNKENRKEVKSVVFSMYGTDYVINLKNLDTITDPEKQKRVYGTYDDAIKDALAEAFER